MQDNEVKSFSTSLGPRQDYLSEGLATGYYGPATRRAIIRFQKKYGIEPVGFVGPLTKKKLNEIYGTKTVQTSSAAAASSVQSSAQPSTTTSASKTKQVQDIQTLINQLLEQVKALQAKKTQ